MSENTDFFTNCPLTKVQKIVGGKWKIVILWYLSRGPKRFGEIKRTFPDITQAMLTKQLRELEEDGFVHREIFRKIPPRVEYSLTATGENFVPILRSMYDWGEVHLGAAKEQSPSKDSLALSGPLIF
ncbi:winged helix-turn-helix transcriptional regulator [Paenibacillus jilunlii]|uniref:MarR family transcriptional regulator n=1 Tax=Paenibacillus jilunlii TaxID=682956 RepID=A0A1G9J6U7_9BACL|nr:helix-turn-helix domain-containing protein [Paenibacillus jilunlii]KWX74780.1 MarR family transcriptional regulator [Paenibacillus jilunlii]SDL32965.1 transcriptional regulator, HxlR family [Paenibacillus jilunlii]